MIYQDETWEFQYGTGNTLQWQDNDKRSVSCDKTSNVGRFIACHAGGRDGFVDNASLFYLSSDKPKEGSDYHGDFNGPNFEKWVQKQLIPNLSRPSIIIIDNASYHNVQVE